MDIFIKELRIRKSLFSKKTYLHFKYLLYDGWHKGKTEYRISNSASALTETVNLIGAYINEKALSKKTVWSQDAIKTHITTVSYFAAREYDSNCTKIRL